mmetsp:Transcript_8671/g.29777  ORF Transcript_8671/g.29777 Transcript_8671/m.29777 type:complete len:177 (-) Transcript_8671:3381-3911(-)
MGGMNGEKPTVYHHLKTSTVSAKFLKTNQTSHAWVFGAIAELLDNAMDPDCMANSVHISLRSLGDEPALIIMDDGNGMDPDCLLKMLSFGFSDKTQVEVQGRRSIGHYGNGFKSGSMRIGHDALSFSQSEGIPVRRTSFQYLPGRRARRPDLPSHAHLGPQRQLGGRRLGSSAGGP